MPAKKYSDELKMKLREMHANGARKIDLSKEYNIPYKSVDAIVNQEIKENRTRRVLQKKDDMSLESKVCDAIAFKRWKSKLIERLRTEKIYLGQPIIYIGQNEFTYRCRYGYNDTKAYVDLYAKRK